MTERILWGSGMASAALLGAIASIVPSQALAVVVVGTLWFWWFVVGLGNLAGDAPPSDSDAPSPLRKFIVASVGFWVIGYAWGVLNDAANEICSRILLAVYGLLRA